MMETTISRSAPAWALAVAMSLAAVSAEAGSVRERYFGEDLEGGSRARTRPNTESAFAAFIARVPGALSEDFESDTLFFPPAIGGDLVSSDAVSDADGRFPLSGRRYAVLSSSTAPGASFAIDLPLPATAFGFFGIDIGDFNESLTLRVEFDDGSTDELVVPHTRESARANGGVFFQGIVADAAIASVRFVNLNPAGGPAILGFDDLVVGRALEAPVPVAGTLALLAPAALGLLATRRRRVD